MLVNGLTRVVDSCSRRPRLTLLLAFAALTISIVLLARVRIDSSLSAMLGGDNAAAEALAHITDDFHAAEDLLVLASAPASLPAPQAEQALLEFAGRLVAAASQPGAVEAGITGARYRPDPAFETYIRETVLPAGTLWLDDGVFDDLVRRLRPEEVQKQLEQNATLLAAPGPGAAALAKRLVKDPLRLREFFLSRFALAENGDASIAATGADFSDDRHSILIRVSGAQPVNDIEFGKRFTRAVRELVNRENTSGLRVRIGGGHAIAASTAEAIRRDAIVSTIVAGVLVYLFLAVAFRRWLAPITIMLTAGTGVTVAFGVSTLFIHSLTPLTAVLASLLAGLGVEYAIHFRSYHDTIAATGVSSKQASVRAARHLAGPLTAVCLTSIFGFGAIDLSGVRMLRDFANLGCAGLVGAFLAAWLVLPAILALSPRPRVRPGAQLGTRGGFAGMLLSIATCRPARSIGIGASLAAAALTVIGMTPGFVPKFETNTSVLHPQPSEPLETGRMINERFHARGENLLVRIVGDSPEALASRSHEVANRLSTLAARRAGVSRTLGLASLVPDPRLVPHRLERLRTLDVEAIITGINDEVARSEFEPAGFQDFLRFLRRLLITPHAPSIADVAARPEIARQLLPRVAVEDDGALPRQTLVLVSATKDKSGPEALPALSADIRALLHGVPGATLTGFSVVSHDLESAARRDVALFGAISVTLVVVWLFIFLRRPVDVALAFIPVIFSIVCVLALMSALGQRLNPVNIVAIPLLAGIAVDCGIYLVAAARDNEVAENAGRCDSDLRVALRPTVHAIICTGGTTMLGFGTLILTHTPAVRSLGWAMLTGVSSALVACLLILAPVLVWRASKPRNAAE